MVVLWSILGDGVPGDFLPMPFQESPVELVASPGLDLDPVNESSVGEKKPYAKPAYRTAELGDSRPSSKI